MKMLQLTLYQILLICVPIYGDGVNEYIREETEDLQKLVRNSKFSTGTLYFDDDSVVTELLHFRKRDEMNSYLFCVSKSENDSLVVYTADDICGYKIGDDYYQTCRNAEARFFIHRLQKGKIELYERKRIPGDNAFLYYLKIPGFTQYFVINPLEKNISEQRLPTEGSRATQTYFASENIPEKFKLFVIRYLGDCASVSNMVSSEFYSIYDIPSIVEDYNQCKHQ